MSLKLLKKFDVIFFYFTHGKLDHAENAFAKPYTKFQ